MNERQSWVFNKNNKNVNIILKNFLIEFEYIINCHEILNSLSQHAVNSKNSLPTPLKIVWNRNTDTTK